jgi:hypothetical protein
MYRVQREGDRNGKKKSVEEGILLLLGQYIYEICTQAKLQRFSSSARAECVLIMREREREMGDNKYILIYYVYVS